MRELIGAAFLATALAVGCTTTPAGPTPTAGPTALGGAVAAQLCDANNPAGLTTIIDLAETFRENGDSAPLVAIMATTLGLVQQLQFESGSEPARWQAASVDAVEQLQRRINEPERAPEVARHLVRTVGIFRDQICP